MNARAQSQVQSSSTSFTLAPVNIVQRKCACGGTAGLSGECAECRKEKLVGENPPLIQPKLKISQPNDKYEQEADETIQTKPIANEITISALRRAEKEEEETIQLKRASYNRLTFTPARKSKSETIRQEKVKELSAVAHDFIRNSSSSPVSENDKAEPTRDEHANPATSACPANVDFEVKSQFIKNAARTIEHPAPVTKPGQSGANVAIVPSGDIEIRATVNPRVRGVASKSDKSKAILQHWQVGFTQTMYQDFSVAQYDKSRVFVSQIREAGGPVIDVKKNQVPFGGVGGVGADLLEETPLELVTGDVPSAPVGLLNPYDHKFCDPPDLLRLFFRELDVTTFIIAFNKRSNFVCPLEFFQWRQLTDVRVSGIRVEPIVDGFQVKSVTFTPNKVDGVTLLERGRGEGPRPPETATKSGKVANDFQGSFFFEDKTC